MAADSDPIPNSDSPLTSSEESALSPDNPASQFAELPQPVLSEDASRAKLRGEGPVFGEAEQSSSKRFPLNESDEASRAKMHPVRSFGTKEDSPFQDEIDSMRRVLKRLVESFSNVEDLDEQFKLSSAINYTTASLTRLVRAQQILRDHQPNTFDQSVKEAINIVLKEWGWN